MSAELLLRDDRSTVSPLVYKGLWQKDEMNGEGIISLSNGLVVYALFKDGIVRDTHFQVLYPNGDIYAGAHRGGVKQGVGTYIYNDEAGTRYEGDWVDNLKEGKGEMTFTNTVAKFKGTFEDDEIKQGEYIDAFGNSFKAKPHPEENQQHLGGYG